MKNTLLLIAFTFPLIIFAQTDLNSIAADQYQINRTGMIILGSWAIANLGTGLYGNARFDGEQKYFHQMNAMWNTVNLGLATAGFFSAKSMLTDPTLSSVLDNQHSMEKILLVNAALDVGYIATGFLLRERAGNVTKNIDRLKGYGKSLILQGAFLLVFDAIMYGIHHTNHSKIMDKISLLSMNFNPSVGLSVEFHFQL